MTKQPSKTPAEQAENDPKKKSVPAAETGGPAGPEPTRYGDWEIAGKCVDF